jgi:dihydrofolate synthase / folylpolyglutamate synthase
VDKVDSYEKAIAALVTLIPKNKQFKFAGVIGLQRIKKLLELLGNPQEKLKVIHIAGTSGKTSTSTILASLLKDQGFKVGLTISPHLSDIRERLQINNLMISKKESTSVCNQVLSKIDLLSGTKFAGVTYFEALISMAYFYFHQVGVDYAVVETGLGGTYDGTNVVSNPNKLAIITRIGLDHTQILGNSLPEIAAQKAGIIQPGNTVLTLQQLRVLPVFANVCRQLQANLIIINPEKNYSLIKNSNRFNFNFKSLNLAKINLNLLGNFQIENSSLALTALQILSQRDNFQLNNKQILNTLNTITIPGRFSELKFKERHLILDGAHNPQKMNSFIKSLKQVYKNEKFVFIIAFKKNKQYQQCLRTLLPLADYIVIAEFFKTDIDTVPKSIPAAALAGLFKKWDFHNFEITHSANTALDTALKATSASKIVVTGSLYLISDLMPFLSESTPI